MKPRNKNLYNGDTTFLFMPGYQTPPEAPYDASVFHRFIDVLADSGVDTYICNTNAQVPWYPSRAVPGILHGYTRGDREFFRGHYPPANDTDFTEAMLSQRLDENVTFLNRYLDLADAGVDWVEEVSKACRCRRMAPWFSIRMNDMHGGNSWERSYMNCALQRDPKYRLTGREINPRHGFNRWHTPLDFRHQEVRDYYFAQIRELVEEYDFEGLELDWMRQPFCLEPPADQNGLDIMTDWIADIRQLTQLRGEQIGKPYPLGVRIPVRLDLLHSIGLDIRSWASHGLIDFVGCSNGWQTTWDVPYDTLRRELGPDVALYGVVEDAPNWMFAQEASGEGKTYRLLSASSELLRGNAAGKLALGADGIETFNFFCTDTRGIDADPNKREAKYQDLRDLEKLEELRGQTKHYALASSHGYFMFHTWEYAEQLPQDVEPEWKRSFNISMCREPVDSGLKLTVQLVVERRAELPDLGVSFNGSWPNFEVEATDQLLFPTGQLTHHVAEHQALNFHFDTAVIKEGWNEILVFNGNRAPETAEERHAQAARVVSVEVALH